MNLNSSLHFLISTFSLVPFMLLTLTNARPSSHDYPSPSTISTIIPEGLYNTLFLHKDDAACPAKGFYPYEAFLRAACRYPRFGNTGSLDTRKREVAAFLAQSSHETTGGWATAPDGPYAWGFCFKEEISPRSDYCDVNETEWPCYPGASYKGRGPIQLSWNYNYGPVGKSLGLDLLRNPGIVANDSLVAFETALWFWMTPRKPKPSCHEVMVGKYRLKRSDLAANRTSGFGLVTNIVNGGSSAASRTTQGSTTGSGSSGGTPSCLGWIPALTWIVPIKNLIKVTQII